MHPVTNPFAVPRPPKKVTPLTRFTRTVEVANGSFRGIVAEDKTINIMSVKVAPWSRHIAVGDELVIHAVHEFRKPSVTVVVSGVCLHPELPDIVTCEQRHDPASILPHAPTWKEVLERASVGDGRCGVPSKGWVVVTYYRKPGTGITRAPKVKKRPNK